MSTEQKASLMQRFGFPPDEIYRRSFALVDALLPAGSWTPDEREILRRIVHATGDPQLASVVCFTNSAIDAGLAALEQGATIFTDVRMVAAGINLRLTQALGCSVQALIEQEGLEERARAAGITRSAAAIEAALPALAGVVVVIGNAPTALLRLLDALDAGQCKPPALIVGMPVGFVATPESKAALLERRYPAITIEGTRGGSPLAAAAVNALLSLTLRRREQSLRNGTGQLSGEETNKQ